MAKKDAYYFSHDANAQDDPKCMILIDQLGMEGYGIYWALIEKLRNEKDYKLPLTVVGSLAKRWSTSKEKVATVIKKYGLFEVENDLFFSLRLVRSMNEKSEKARLSAGYRWGNNATALQSHTERNADGMRNDAIKEKESKVKEKKVNNNKADAFTKPTKEIIKEQMILRGIDAARAELESFKFISYYDSNGWKVGKNNMKSWPGALGTWLSNLNKFNSDGQQPTTTGNKQPNHGQSAGAIKLAHSLAADCNIDQQGRKGNTGNEIPFADIQ